MNLTIAAGKPLAFCWRTYALYLLWFIAGVFVVMATKSRSSKSEALQVKSGDLLLILAKEDFLLPNEPLQLGQSIRIVKLRKPRSFDEACQINRKPVKLVANKNHFFLSVSMDEWENWQAILRHRVKNLALLANFEKVVTPPCSLRNAILFHQ